MDKIDFCGISYGIIIVQGSIYSERVEAPFPIAFFVAYLIRVIVSLSILLFFAL